MNIQRLSWASIKIDAGETTLLVDPVTNFIGRHDHSNPTSLRAPVPTATSVLEPFPTGQPNHSTICLV